MDPSTTLPTESSSSKHSKLGKLQTLVGLGRGRTVRADARPTATPSQSPHPPSDPVRRETSSPRRPPIAGAGRIQAQASARANAPVSHPSQETRHALLTFEESFTRVPITPATKARQLLTSASTLLSDKINDRNSVLFETCPGLGLERPIRMYEGLRPVVDSWEADSQSAFSIITNPSSDSMVEAEKMAAQSGLEAIDAPRRQPETTTFQLHHCTKSEKWHKRYVTLRSDGKMLIAKKEHGKDSTNVCHMSDFDIYCLRRRQGSHFRPHKKYCYAIKSQQKLSMFLSAEDYMHYFCTNDAQVANDFYAAIHAWRSWYLMQLASEERQSSSGSGESAPVTPSDHGLSPISSPRSATARRNPAIAHQLGSLKPLISQESMDLDGADPGASDLDQRLADSSKLVSRAKTVRKFGTGRMKATAAVYDDVSGAFVTARSRAATAGAASSGLPEQPFISSGLLGKQYEERQREMRAREAASGNEFGGPAVADGPDLMASRTGQSGTMRERGRYRGMREAGPEKRAVSRARSVARGQAPAMRSKSVKAGPRGVTEVDGVAGDQEPFTRGVGAMVRTRTVNHRSQSRGPAVTRNQPLSPTNPFHSPQDMALNAAFDGRMPTLPVSWREPQQTPRNGPLINLNEQSQFAEGSLLRQYESLAAPPHGPIIDRHVPGKTVLVKTGEGF
ncbi:hypothetical protein KEM52_002959 [Ascosphaera acerosa]|nr:hypothetical protein KEM52_002959 [Ascosphaera acerosa]